MHPNPDESFIPLAPAKLPPNQRQDFRVTVMSQAGTKPFPSLDQKNSWSSLSQASTNEPRVTLQHEGDQVSTIRIQCTCGRTVELACVYDTPSAPQPAPPSQTTRKEE
jgi:hypothetical protein